jgi:hypothetical protein
LVLEFAFADLDLSAFMVEFVKDIDGLRRVGLRGYGFVMVINGEGIEGLVIG